jgi:hypothetical protein
MPSGAATNDASCCEPSLNALTEAALHGITRALASVGRAFICLDPSFRILHVSKLLNDFLGQGVAAQLTGRPIARLQLLRQSRAR